MTNIKQQQAKTAPKAGISEEQQAERKRIALAASWEICALSRHLNATLPDLDECVHIRALAVRINRLNSICMSILDGDTTRSTQEIHDILEGVTA